jgi:hypothetical protein
MARSFAAAAAGIALTITACAPRAGQGKTVALDADVDDGLGGTGIESGDVRAAADRIARALSKDHGKAGAARVAVLPVANHTRFRIDAGLVHDHLVHDLARHGRGRFGVVQQRSPAMPTTASAVLRTELRSLTKETGRETSDYVQYFFVLEDPRDGAVLWSGMYETKRLSDVAVVYR